MSSALGSQSSARLDTSAIEEIPDEDPQQNLFHQVFEWLEHEKARRKIRKARRNGAGVDSVDGPPEGQGTGDESRSSDGSFSLDMLEKILHQYAGSGLEPVQYAKRVIRRRHRGLRRGSASESECTDVEATVPSVDAWLDNSKTLAYPSSTALDEELADSTVSLKRAKDKESWTVFKTEILRLAHTLQLRGWRKVSMDDAADMDVIRLSGALTNAVYVVKPPKHIPVANNDNSSSQLIARKPPPKLLLRIYGPQVDHLIDREKELQILRRLGRKNIGPRMLGTFNNGRFEEFFEARPLSPGELRQPETAKQIAKRMRELHDGIELLDEEREGGPAIFMNWDKWVDRCEQVTTWLDKELESPENDVKAATEPWRQRGFVCGVPWAIFRKAVENYRIWLIASCGGIDEIKRQLVFAHNDTQYGNLLRMEPATESPLLLPANKHKQLVVIDFEYSSANTAGFEFANHFTEWCYNYHDEERAWACNNRTYPTPEEQQRFLWTYIHHRPAVTGGVVSPLATPAMRGRTGTSIAHLDLDDTGTSTPEIETTQEDEVELEMRHLLRQTRLWRVMCSAQWVAWGIVQAKASGMKEGIAKMSAAENGNGHHNGNGEEKRPPVDSDIDEEEEFDYLAYSQDRAMFFWADLLAMNLVNADDLPPLMLEHLKTRIIDY
ncbi:hypothetical protein N7495_002196 [Penicillium taxi]|uniref:uncharacterized protein n=1 Tax=Penicillium taxi TaxID=168475 RepID=UPI0025459CC2|nr:uncharacterized protein N7495_002196 [Penicillium taxi]KAJ5901668.1 hypothetical protein N7495_002196 [Penicillium taxi]